ncbi:MAG: acyl-CoA thioesterase [Lentimicrobium sp.]|nr:acyl-CoA thioesterase [Lentimicrobium sp.]
MKERIAKSETRHVRIVFPNTLNDHETLFGGEALKWMDEVAYITAIRFLRRRIVTVSAENIRFICPIEADSIVEVKGTVSKIGRVKLEIKVEVTMEDMLSEKKEKAIEAIFVFVAVNEKQNPVRL